MVWGCLHPYVGNLAITIIGLNAKFKAMSVIEILLYKLLQVFAYRFTVDLNDDTWSSVFLIFNLMVSISVQVLLFVTFGTSPHLQLLKVLSCGETTISDHFG